MQTPVRDRIREVPGPLAPPAPAEPTPDPVDLAVIVPAYNEIAGIARTLELVHHVLARVEQTSEVIVVDDGSQDGTADAARACGVRVIAHDVNRGYGAALKTGILNTRAAAVAIIDADATYPADAIPRLYERLA